MKTDKPREFWISSDNGEAWDDKPNDYAIKQFGPFAHVIECFAIEQKVAEITYAKNAEIEDLKADFKRVDNINRELNNKLLYHDKIVEHNIDLNIKITGFESENATLKAQLKEHEDKGLTIYGRKIEVLRGTIDTLEAENATLKAQLEKCKQQRDNLIMVRRYKHKDNELMIENCNAELAQLQKDGE